MLYLGFIMQNTLEIGDEIKIPQDIKDIADVEDDTAVIIDIRDTYVWAVAVSAGEGLVIDKKDIETTGKKFMIIGQHEKYHVLFLDNGIQVGCCFIPKEKIHEIARHFVQD